MTTIIHRYNKAEFVQELSTAIAELIQELKETPEPAVSPPENEKEGVA